MTNPRHHPDSPAAQLIDAMIDEQWQRHSWLIEDGERLRAERLGADPAFAADAAEPVSRLGPPGFNPGERFHPSPGRRCAANNRSDEA